MARYLSKSPEWFDLRKYDFMEDLDLEGWIKAIKTRADLEVRLHIKAEGGTEKDESGFTDRFERIKADPSVTFDDTPYINFVAPSNQPIYFLTFTEAKSLVSSLECPAPPPRSGCDQLMRERKFLSCEGRAHLTIDVTASKTHLQEAFKQWLDAHYKEMSTEARIANSKGRVHSEMENTGDFSEKKLESLSSCALLAYKDLLLNSLAYGEHFTSEDACAWLHLDESQVRKAKELASDMFTIPMIRKLQHSLRVK